MAYNILKYARGCLNTSVYPKATWLETKLRCLIRYNEGNRKRMANTEQIKEYLNNLNPCKQINHLVSLGDNKIRQ